MLIIPGSDSFDLFIDEASRKGGKEGSHNLGAGFHNKNTACNIRYWEYPRIYQQSPFGQCPCDTDFRSHHRSQPGAWDYLHRLLRWYFVKFKLDDSCSQSMLFFYLLNLLTHDLISGDLQYVSAFCLALLFSPSLPQEVVSLDKESR